MPTIDPSTMPGMPAPIWFIMFFKIIGFFLHLVPMGIWFAGIPLSVWLFASKNQEGKRFAGRLMYHLPVILAFGINFGIVPLLFTQVMFYKSFYTATILMAWFWLAVIPAAILLYYGVYYCAFHVKRKNLTIPAAVLSVFVVYIALTFAAAMTRMANPEFYLGDIVSSNLDGVVAGFSLPHMHGTWLLRVLLTLSFGVMTLASWMLVDAFFLFPQSDETVAYRNWARRCASRLMIAGAAMVVVVGVLYAALAWQADVSQVMLHGPGLMLSIATLILPLGIPAYLVMAGRGELSKFSVVVVAALQCVSLLVYASARQVVQNVEVSRWFDIFAIKESVQWSPLIAFLVTFVLGALCVVWMFWVLAKNLQKPASD